MTTAVAKIWWSASTAVKASVEERLPYRPLHRLHALQSRRVRAIVAHAQASVPHYREAMQDLGICPGDLRTAADLAALPLIDGRDLADTPERFHSDRFTDADTLTLHSSGTTGRAKAVRYDAAALFTALANGHRQRVVMAHFVGRRFGYREMSAIRAGSVSTQMRRFYETRSLVPRRLELQRRILPLGLPYDEAVQHINDFRPDVLSGYGGHLGALFRWAWENGHELHRPRLVWYGADAMPEADRTLIENTIGVPVVSTYQADEALRIGFQCERRQGFHLCIDTVAVRVVRADGSAAGPGEEGEIVISNLSNRATVLLNYRLGDLVTVSAGPCPCGRTLPTIERIAGRADDQVVLPNGEARHALLFLAPMHAVPGVVQVQLVQHTVDRLDLRVACAAGSEWRAIRDALAAVAGDLLGPDVHLTVRRVPEIPAEPGDKVRAVVSHCRKRHVR